MEEVYEFLKKNGIFYLATVDGEQARVRPIGTIALFEDKLYFETTKDKTMSHQMQVNPHVEISVWDWDAATSLRLTATVVNDDRVEAKRHMLAEYASVREHHTEDDELLQVLYLTDATAVFMGKTKKTITW
jgi:uncharacterized pyridoxamine 5'-phosphate oxidase family protein